MIIYNSKILIIDSEDSTKQLLFNYLSVLGYNVFLASTGKSALTILKKHKPNLVILDIVLPTLDGYQLCSKICENFQTPLIILTALDDVSDRIRCLELGVDDYILKPFSVKELEAKINSTLRRFNKIYLLKTNLGQPQTIFKIGNLFIDLTNHKVLKKNLQVKLTKIEFTLLKLFIYNRDKELSRRTILENVWGYLPERNIDTRVVDVHISRLRAKLEENPQKPDFLMTIRGVGYIFLSRT